MYTYADIKLQNKQDAFSAMYLYGSRSILELCGARVGEGIIREAMRRLGLTETDKPAILMVGDRKFDVLGAKECGIDCAGVEFFGYAAPGELAQAGAVAVVSNAEELEQFILTH